MDKNKKILRIGDGFRFGIGMILATIAFYAVIAIIAAIFGLSLLW